MALRRDRGDALSAWPGYVDALSTLLMVIIFVLLVFVLAQAFLSVALSGRDKALDKLNRQMAEVTDMLSLERGKSNELRLSIAQLNKDLQSATSARDSLTQQLAALKDEQLRTVNDRNALRAERDKLTAQLADARLQSQSASARADQLQAQLADAAAKADKAGQENAAIAAQLTATQGQLAAAQQQLDAMKQQIADLDKTVNVGKETIQAKVSELAKLADQVKALTALRDELEQQAKDAGARALTEQQKREAMALQLQDEQKYSDSAKAQIALLNKQMEQLKAQLTQVSAALDTSDKTSKSKDVQIADLGRRLNVALAAKVEELQKYRSEFFGKLRAVLANRPGIQIVGDRFVFQSEVLFPVGSADMTAAGQDQIRQIATTLKQISSEIPPDVAWILRVDGHADKQPITGGQFTSNWELSTARAITVVKLLIAEGIPPNHLAAAGFGDTQPIDTGDTPEAYAKNRRIELRLTDR